MPSVLFIMPTATVTGGVETWLDELAVSLEQGGWQVRVALLQGALAHDPDRYRKVHPALRTVIVDGRGLNADGRQRAVLRCLRKENPDLCIPLTAVDAHDALCRAKCQGWTGRYVLAVHGNVPVQLADARRHLPYADAVICPGALTSRVMSQFGIAPERLWHIPNGARAATSARRERQVGDGTIRLGYVGRLAGGEKRAGDLLDCSVALTRLGVPYHLTVVGDGPLACSLRQGFRERGLAEQVTFTGALAQQDLFERIYPDLDALLLFSESEAFGIVLVEAMKNGVVPVASRFLGCASERLLKDGVNAQLFGVGDVQAAARLIAGLAANPDELRRRSIAAVASAQSYSWTQCGQQWGKALAAVLRLPPRGVSDTLFSPPIPEGVLGRLGVSPSVTDVIRRLRRRVVGIQPGHVGGEEWPFAHRGYTDEDLETIQRLAGWCDVAASGAGAMEVSS